MDPIDHVVRSSLPWRSESLTECGRGLNDVGSAITQQQLHERVKEYGAQRTAFTVCMTCWTTASAHRETWESDPVALLYRETQRAGGALVSPRSDRPERVLLTAELRAIAALIEAHRDEFDQYIVGLAETASLDAVRNARRSSQLRRAPR